ncbi:hypothetical protein B296_00044864 [Ensete ventricosum]|uniref:Uncharacterized protein n=1 Tax=Ensete ventricosum TaxID=4639 RepID=A0A426Z2C1_ENSVE|nr:hypothetical protein B296_00044864 [Ensete ventricosum]
MSSFGYLALKRPMAGALEAIAEPLRFLVGVHNPPLPLGNIALLLFPGLFYLLDSQLSRDDLSLLPTLYDTFSDHVVSYGRLITGLLLPSHSHWVSVSPSQQSLSGALEDETRCLEAIATDGPEVERHQPTKVLSNGGGVTISKSSRLPSLQGVEVQLATSPCRTFWGLSEDLLMPLIGEYAYLFSGGPRRTGNSG